MRGLPWSTTVDEIIDFFSGCAISHGRDGVFIVMTKEGRPSGEAFIELETEDDLEKALKRDRQYVGTRYIEGKLRFLVFCNFLLILWFQSSSAKRAKWSGLCGGPVLRWITHSTTVVFVCVVYLSGVLKKK